MTKCLMCGYIDDYGTFLYDYDEEGVPTNMRCPECGNSDPDEMVDEDEEDEYDEYGYPV